MVEIMTSCNRAGRKPAKPIAPELMNQAIGEVMTSPWIEVSTLAKVLNIGLQGAYREAQIGRFGAFKVGNQYRVPTAPLREILHLQSMPVVADPVHEAA